MSTVLLAGAQGGLGLALSELWLERGKRVIATARTLEEGSALMQLERRYPALLTVAQLDVAKDLSLRHLGQRLRKEGIAIDLLISRASMRQLLSLDRFDVHAPLTRPLSFQILPALRVVYAVIDLLSTGARVACIATPPRGAAEFGSLEQPPRVSVQALHNALSALAFDLMSREARLGVLYLDIPSVSQRGQRRQDELDKLGWVVQVIDEMVDGTELPLGRPLIIRNGPML